MSHVTWITTEQIRFIWLFNNRETTLFGCCQFVQARHFSRFSHIALIPDETDTKILKGSLLENSRRSLGRPHTTKMKTIQQDLSLNEATDMAQNRPLWRLMSTFGTMQS